MHCTKTYRNNQGFPKHENRRKAKKIGFDRLVTFLEQERTLGQQFVAKVASAVVVSLQESWEIRL